MLQIRRLGIRFISAGLILARAQHAATGLPRAPFPALPGRGSSPARQIETSFWQASGLLPIPACELCPQLARFSIPGELLHTTRPACPPARAAGPFYWPPVRRHSRPPYGVRTWVGAGLRQKYTSNFSQAQRMNFRPPFDFQRPGLN
jgi:hypothetical protein